MSSALDITYRRPKRFEANAEASLLGGSAFVGFSNKKFAWSNGLRYKTNRYLLGTFETNGEYKPSFLDQLITFIYLIAQNNFQSRHTEAVLATQGSHGAIFFSSIFS